MSEQRIAVANAPCSYGAFELTVGVDPLVPPALELLDAVAGAGYAGIDLGPVGYLGAPLELAARLEARGLSLAGGYFEIAFSEPSLLERELVRLVASKVSSNASSRSSSCSSTLGSLKAISK